MIVRRRPSLSYNVHSDTTVSWSTVDDCKKKIIKRKVYWASCLFVVGILFVVCKLASLRGPVKAVATVAVESTVATITVQILLLRTFGVIVASPRSLSD